MVYTRIVERLKINKKLTKTTKTIQKRIAKLLLKYQKIIRVEK